MLIGERWIKLTRITWRMVMVKEAFDINLGSFFHIFVRYPTYMRVSLS